MRHVASLLQKTSRSFKCKKRDSSYFVKLKVQGLRAGEGLGSYIYVCVLLDFTTARREPALSLWRYMHLARLGNQFAEGQ